MDDKCQCGYEGEMAYLSLSGCSTSYVHVDQHLGFKGRDVCSASLRVCPECGNAFVSGAKRKIEESNLLPPKQYFRYKGGN